MFEEVHKFLGEAFPLTSGGYHDATGLQLEGGRLVVALGSGRAELKTPGQFVGYNRGPDGSLKSVRVRVDQAGRRGFGNAVICGYTLGEAVLYHGRDVT